jgi:hypothetical protein
MEQQHTFDLMGYIDDHFSGFRFGGDVLDQWTLGLRFNIGLEHVDRAVAIFEQAFRNADTLVLINEYWRWDFDPGRWYALFALPRLLRTPSATVLTSCQPRWPMEDDEAGTLTWAEIPRPALASEVLFHAIANQDHGRTPSVLGRTFILDPVAQVLLHMYDDRGLDIIAKSALALLPIHKQFADWINRTKMD